MEISEILYFEAEWCESCRNMKPKFKEVCRKRGFTNYRFIDTDDADNCDLLDLYKVKQLPTLVFKKCDGDWKSHSGSDGFEFAAGLLDKV